MCSEQLKTTGLEVNANFLEADLGSCGIYGVESAIPAPKPSAGSGAPDAPVGIVRVWQDEWRQEFVWSVSLCRECV